MNRDWSRISLLNKACVIFSYVVAAALFVFDLAAAFGACAATAYPGPITQTDLVPVWENHQLAGRDLGLVHHLPADAALLPKGSHIDGTDVHMTSGSLKGWDFSGFDIYVDGGQVVTFSGAKFRNPGGGPLLGIGIASGGVATSDVVTCIDCEFDETGIQNANLEAGVKAYGSLTLVRAWLHDAPRDFIAAVGPALTISDSYLQCPGKRQAMAADPEQHVEAIHLYMGSVSFSRVDFDVSDCGATLQGNWTTPAFFSQAFRGNLFVYADRIVVTGGAAVIGTHGSGTSFTLQQKASISPAFSSTTIISNSAIERGVAGYTTAANGAVLIDGGGNVDATTGQPVNLAAPNAPAPAVPKLALAAPDPRDAQIAGLTSQLASAQAVAAQAANDNAALAKRWAALMAGVQALAATAPTP